MKVIYDGKSLVVIIKFNYKMFVNGFNKVKYFINLAFVLCVVWWIVTHRYSLETNGFVYVKYICLIISFMNELNWIEFTNENIVFKKCNNIIVRILYSMKFMSFQ